jgi:hypothetical protein
MTLMTQAESASFDTKRNNTKLFGDLPIHTYCCWEPTDASPEPNRFQKITERGGYGNTSCLPGDRLTRFAVFVVSIKVEEFSLSGDGAKQ